MTGADPYDLERFVQAQAPVFETALAELRAGRKRSHWMWFIFPQLKGLGRSPTAQFYGIASLGEARAYLAHPELGRRLRTATRAALDGPEQGLDRLFGAPDDAKFISCMSLFAKAEPGGLFTEALARWNGGRPDPLTTGLLGDAA
jgi:uncharacterized protein (DUF1810 family)